MDDDTAKRLVKAARALLRLDVETFAKGLGVGAATVKRIEADHAVHGEALAEVLARLPALRLKVLRPDRRRGIAGGIALTTQAPAAPDGVDFAPVPRGRPRRTAEPSGAGSSSRPGRTSDPKA